MIRCWRLGLALLCMATASSSMLSAQQMMPVAGPSSAIIHPMELDPPSFHTRCCCGRRSRGRPLRRMSLQTWLTMMRFTAVKQVMEEEAAKKKAEEESKNAQAKCEGRLPDNRQMTGSWNNGLEFSTKNQRFQVPRWRSLPIRQRLLFCSTECFRPIYQTICRFAMVLTFVVDASVWKVHFIAPWIGVLKLTSSTPLSPQGLVSQKPLPLHQQIYGGNGARFPSFTQCAVRESEGTDRL